MVICRCHEYFIRCLYETNKAVAVIAFCMKQTGYYVFHHLINVRDGRQKKINVGD